MLELILPPHEQASRALGSKRAGSCPKDWPGQYVPNFDDWLPGDIVLVERDEEGTGRSLEIGQTISFNRLMRAGSRWSHAALYLGGGDIVEAIPRHGVVRRSIWNHCQTRAIRVRRLPSPVVTERMAQRVADFAETFVGRRYSLKEVLRSKLVPNRRPDVMELYCSTFIGLAVAGITQLMLWDGPEQLPLYPAILAAHPDLADVPLLWRHL